MEVSSTSPGSPRASKRQRTRRSSERLQSRSSTASSSTASTTSHKRDSGTPSTSYSPAPTTTVSSDRLKRFHSWCRSQGIHIDPVLDLRYSGDAVSWSISIHARTDIDNDSVVATIPKTAVLSRKTSALSSVLKGKWLSDSHETVGLELALCLLYERCLGSKSRFEPFLSILPRLPVPLPFLRDPSDADRPWRWISGTETARIDHRATFSYQLSSSSHPWPYDHDYGMSKQKALDYFYSTGIPILSRSKLFDATQKQHLDGLESAFLTAYTHVSSRDFIVDTHHGVGMVPVADLFNHAEVHTVQFESDQDVCEICGVAFLTGHEEEMCRFGMVDSGSEEDAIADEEEQDEATQEDEASGEEEERATTASDAAEEEEKGELEDHTDTLDMRTLTSHTSGSEMYNTYGPLTNALLLTRYGFCLDTETDMERFTVDLRFPRERKAFLQSFLDPDFGFPSLAKVSAAFDEVLSSISERFPRPDSEEQDEDEQDEMDPALRIASNAIDALHQLERLLPTAASQESSWISETLCPLYSNMPDQPDAIDEDLVERDQIHPLFISSTGRPSLPLFLLSFLVLHHRSDPHSPLDMAPSQLQLESRPTQNTLRTLHAFWLTRLEDLYISNRVEEALQQLEDAQVDYIEKACIQHAYQEYAAVKAAISTLQDLIVESVR